MYATIYTFLLSCLGFSTACNVPTQGFEQQVIRQLEYLEQEQFMVLYYDAIRLSTDQSLIYQSDSPLTGHCRIYILTETEVLVENLEDDFRKVWRGKSIHINVADHPSPNIHLRIALLRKKERVQKGVIIAACKKN